MKKLKKIKMKDQSLIDRLKADTHAFASKEQHDVEDHFHKKLGELKKLTGKDNVSRCMKQMYHYGLCKPSALFLRVIIKVHNGYSDEWENFYDNIPKLAGSMEDWMKSNRNRSSNNSTSSEGTPNLNISAKRRKVDDYSNRHFSPLPVLHEDR